ncbi:MAG: M55 family metallopeptidase [Candidatus Omnitrophica bacterium]|nr:M55 family metallopeptidase [Candidatus Omnitrophota bacterium]
MTRVLWLRAKYFYDGVERGEIYQAAVITGYFNVPVILVTGDEAACREAAILLVPEEARTLLREETKKAIRELPRRQPYKIRRPVKLKNKKDWARRNQL